MLDDPRLYITDDELRAVVKTHCFDKKCSINALAEELGVRPSQLYDWMAGTSRVKYPPISLLVALGYQEIVLYKKAPWPGRE